MAALVAVCSATALAKLAGAAKVVFVARYYGISDELDAYWIAFLAPSFLADLLAAAAGPALVPVFIAARERQGRDAARRLLSGAAAAGLALSLLLSLALLAAAGSLLRWAAPGFSAEKLELTRSVLFLLAPILALGSVAALWRAALNALGQFSLPAATYGLTPLAIIAAVTWGGPGRSPFVLAWGTAAGALLEAGVLGWRLHASGFSPLPRWTGLEPNLRRVLGAAWPVLASSFVWGASTYVNQSMAAALAPGGVSALNYGNRLLNVLLALGPAALGTAVLPQFSLLAARGHRQVLHDTYRDCQRAFWWVALPLTALLIAGSEPLVRLLFQGGQFSAADTRKVVEIQRLYLLQAPAVIPAVVLARLFSSLQLNRLLLAAAAAGLTANVALNLWLMRSLGVAGIALSASIAAYVYLGSLAGMLFRIERRRLAAAADE